MKSIGLLLTLLTLGPAASASPTIISLIDGADMAGMEVTVTFDNGVVETSAWAATGLDSGEASGTNWVLSQAGNTLGSTDLNNPLGYWTLSNSGNASLTALKVDGALANIYFDVILADYDTSFPPLNYDEGTTGSRQGRPFTVFPPNTLGIDSDLVDPTGNGIDDVDYLDPFSSPDLFGAFEVNLGSGLAGGESLRFWIDTDRLSGGVVPEPPLYGLLALGLLGFSMRRRKEAAAF